MEQNQLLNKLQEIRDLQASREAIEEQVNTLKAEVLLSMEEDFLDKVDASDSVGVIALKIVRKDYHFDDLALRSLLGARYSEVLKVDKKRVKDIEKESPELELGQAIIVDKTTTFLEVKKAKKNGSTHTTTDTI